MILKLRISRSKIIILLSFAFLALDLSAQQRELTLEEAVLGQYRQFAPDRMIDFQWIPDSEKYSYLDGYTKLIIGDLNKAKDSTILSIYELNDQLGSEFRYFQNFKWFTESSFFIGNELAYYKYDLTSNKGEKIDFNGEAANIDLDAFNGNIAYTKENNLFITLKKKNIQITDFSDPNIVSGQSVSRNEMGIKKGTFWSPNGAFLAFYQKDESEVHNYPLLNIDDYPGSLEMIKYPMAGQSSEKVKVGIYSIENGKTNYISPRSGEESYLTNVSWSFDGQFVLIAEVNRDQNHMWLNLYSNAGKFLKTLFEEEKTTWVEPEHPAIFINDSNDFIWISERDGFNNLYHYTIDGDLLKQITKNQFVIKEVVHKLNDRLFYLATGPNPLNTMLYEVDLKGNQKLLSTTEGTHNPIFSPSGKFFYDYFQSSSVPGVCSIYQNDGTLMKVLLESSNPYDKIQLASVEINLIVDEEGNEFYTRLIKPSNFDETKKYPVLVYVYGGPHAQLITNSWLSGASLWMHWMAQQGYLVFTLDNRGSAERGVAFEHAIHRRLGTIEMEDQLMGVAYLKSLPCVDENRLAVHGWSFGGFMTSTLMLRSPGVFTTGVAGGPVTDWKYYEIMYGERYMDSPDQNVEGYNTASLLNYTSQLEGKLMLIHGTIDDVVVMQHNFALVQSFIKEGKQIDFFPYPMHKHNIYGQDRVHLMTKILNFIIVNN